MLFQLDSSQFELMESILHNDGSVVLANNEKIIVPDSLRFIWEVSEHVGVGLDQSNEIIKLKFKTRLTSLYICNFIIFRQRT